MTPALSFDELLRILDALRAMNPTESRDADLPVIETYVKAFRATCAVGGTAKLDALVANFTAARVPPLARLQRA